MSAAGSKAALAYFETLLTENWSASYDGPAGTRNLDVPEPAIAIEADVDVSRMTQQHEDLCFILDGGPQSITPRSVGWTERRTETLVTIDLRTSHSRGRLEGTRDANNEAEAYGGLRGEVLRILDTVRKGDKEYDWIDGYEWNDLSGEVGYGFWRGTWEIRGTTIAETINP